MFLKIVEVPFKDIQRSLEITLSYPHLKRAQSEELSSFVKSITPHVSFSTRLTKLRDFLAIEMILNLPLSTAGLENLQKLMVLLSEYVKQELVLKGKNGSR